MALKGLCRYEDALISLLHCAAMERTLLSDVREEIAKVTQSKSIDWLLVLLKYQMLHRYCSP